MFMDALLRVSNAQAVTVTAVSTSSIDLGNITPKRAIGSGEPMGFAVAVGVAADFTTGDESYQLDLIQSATEDLATPDVILSEIRTAAQLVAGALVWVPIPKGWPTKRFIGLRYTVGGTTPTVTVTAWLTTHSMFSVASEFYAKNYVV